MLEWKLRGEFMVKKSQKKLCKNLKQIYVYKTKNKGYLLNKYLFFDNSTNLKQLINYLKLNNFNPVSFLLYYKNYY